MSDFMRQDFASRRLKNPRFSLRAYAKVLAISPAHLSLILANKRPIRADSALRIATALGLTPTEALKLYQGESGQSEASGGDLRYLTDDEFSLIAHWHYYAILGLAGLRSNVADPRWISRRLRIPLPAAQACFEKLLAHGYLEVKGGQFRQSSPKVQTPHDVPSTLVRRYHKQVLQVASERIDTVDVSHREYVTMTFPINAKKLKAAKAMIRKFKEEFCEELQIGRPNEVYALSIQFFPLTDVSPKGE